MSSVLILDGTGVRQTAKIAERIATTIEDRDYVAFKNLVAVILVKGTTV